MTEENSESRNGGWLPWARLVRLPAIPTAATNIFAGYLLAHGEWIPVSNVLLLCASSCLLYASGMVLNDYCDIERDRQDAPHRPLPSGQIAKASAFGLYFTLTILGLALALRVSLASFWIACAIVASVYAYSSVLKTTLLAAPMMGLCRALNVMLGASVCISNSGRVPPMVWWYAIGLGVLICGLTVFARDERGDVSQKKLLLGGGLMFGGLVSIGILAELQQLAPDYSFAWLNRSRLALGLVFLPVMFRVAKAIRSCDGADVQRAVKTTIRSLVFLDAAVCLLAAPQSPLYALLVLLMLLPVLFFARAISTT